MSQHSRLPIILIVHTLSHHMNMKRYMILIFGLMSDCGLMPLPSFVMHSCAMILNMQHAYEMRAAHYTKELESLDAFIREQISGLAPEQRILVTAHDAFHYFGRAYGFTVVALQGISTESEAGIKDVQELVSYIVEHNVRALFVEASIPERNIQAVQQATRARGFEVGIGDQLYSDALGPIGSGADTYIGMVRHNIEAIVSALL